MQQTIDKGSYKGEHRLWLVVARKVLLVFLSLLLSMLLLFAVFAVGEQLLDYFFMHPAHISDCLNGGGKWFYELNGCSD